MAVYGDPGLRSRIQTSSLRYGTEAGLTRYKSTETKSIRLIDELSSNVVSCAGGYSLFLCLLVTSAVPSSSLFEGTAAASRMRFNRDSANFTANS